MSEDDFTIASPEQVAPQHSKTEELVQRLVLRDPNQDYWSNVILWIGFAEALMPSVVLFLGMLNSFATSRKFEAILVNFLPTLIAALGLGFTVLFAMTLIVAGTISVLVGFACKTLSIPTNTMPVGAFTGGCVGLVLSTPFVGSTLYSIVVLVLAVLLGQLGGAYGAERTFFRVRAANSSESSSMRFRFGTKQLLILTGWLAVMLTLLKLTGMEAESSLPFLGTWVVQQFAGVGAVWLWEHSTSSKEEWAGSRDEFV